MDNDERQQIRLILEDALDISQRSIESATKELYAQHSASGLLRSGATLKKKIALLEREGEKFISGTLDQISTVAMDVEAFQMFGEQLEHFFSEARRDLEDDKVISIVTKQSRTSSAGKAFWQLFNESVSRLKRQKDIRAFSFTKPAPSRRAEFAGRAANLAKPQAKNSGGKPLAKHWDSMWAAIAVQLYVGDLKPETQADIEKAMMNWLSDQNIDAGERTVRNRARVLWQALIEID